MRRSIVVYILGGIGCSVIILLGYSVTMVLTIFFSKNILFEMEKKIFGLPDFVSGADTFFTIVLLFSYSTLAGFFQRIGEKSKKWRLIKHAILTLGALLCVEVLLPYKETIEITSKFSYLSYPVLLFSGLIREYFFKNNVSTIDQTFQLFPFSLATSIILLSFLHLVNGFTFSFLGEIKLIIILSFTAFFLHLAAIVLFNSYNKEKK